MSSCADARLKARLATAAETKGAANAAVDLPPWPDDCRRKETHAALAEGASAVVALKRERGALDRANARVGRCASHYDNVRAELGKAGG